MNATHLDLDLVRKYNVPGPRYTSYPPATRFTEEVTWPRLADEILLNNRSHRDLSLYFHLPFCRSLCWFCGCTTVITTRQDQSAVYLDYLKKEIAQTASMVNPERKVVQLHWGGGTPTFLQPSEIRELGTAIRDYFPYSDSLEAGVEIDPRRATPEHLQALREVGFNRASLGVQDLDPVVQKAVHRVQPLEMTQKVVSGLRSLGFESLNIDLIYGLPHQTAESFDQTLDAVLELNPDRLAVFSYAHVPWIKPSQKILESAMPSPETKLRILQRTVEKLTGDAGYVYIGMDHFARRDDELAVAQTTRTLHRNFQGYSTRGGSDIYSFGMSAISQIPSAYWQNAKDLPSYYGALDAGKSPIIRGYVVSEEDRFRRETIMHLMCDLELNFEDMSQRLGISFQQHFANELENMEDLADDGLVVQTRRGLYVTQLGRFFIRNIAMRFDAYLPKETERRFSRTI